MSPGCLPCAPLRAAIRCRSAQWAVAGALCLVLISGADAAHEMRLPPLDAPLAQPEWVSPFAATSLESETGTGPLIAPAIDGSTGMPPIAEETFAGDGRAAEWQYQTLPSGLIYRTYLAGNREPRIALISGNQSGFGSQWDASLGGRVALLRYGTTNDARPNGFELELEGAVFPRIAPTAPSSPLVASDYRVGIPLAYGIGAWHYKLAYYHLSSHLGDEWMLSHPGIERINYVRDEVVFGAGVYIVENWRLFGEIGYALNANGGAEPLEFQFGGEYSPVYRNDWRGAPFGAMYGRLREENAFGGSLSVQTGWQWRNGQAGHLFRLGVEYLNGVSEQGEFFNQHEKRLGLGAWYDF